MECVALHERVIREMATNSAKPEWKRTILSFEDKIAIIKEVLILK
jgi:hypothetical protein